MDNADLAVKLQKVDDRSQRNEGRIKKLEETQTALNELALSVKELATDQMNMKKDIVEIKTDVKALTSIPSKRWKLLSKKWFWLLWVQSSLFFSERSGSDKMFFSKRWLNRMTIVVLILIVCCAFGLPLVDITLAANRTFSHSIPVFICGRARMKTAQSMLRNLFWTSQTNTA